MEPILEAKSLNLWYGPNHALHDVSVAIPERQITAFIGPSGCGKSTFLRTLNRMNDLIPSVKIQGQVNFHGKNIYDARVDPTLLRKRIGMVFQSYALFPNMTAAENIAFGLKMNGVPAAETAKKVTDAVALVELTGNEKKYPHQLSGGQKQRVAVASAIASERPLILFDEPTSGLDLFHMRQVANVVNQVANAGRTALVVTHDPEFILRCCNYVLHLENGQIQESYSIEDSNGQKRLLKFFLSDMKKEVSTE